MMPIRRKRDRKHAISPAVIEQFRQEIRSGYPWLHAKAGQRVFGHFDLIALIQGYHYDLCEFWQDEDDEEVPRFLWSKLKPDIMEQHVKRIPGTRPSSWWRFDAAAKLRIVDYERERSVGVYNGKQIMRKVPKEEWEPIFENERTYLERLKLFTDFEKEIFRKFGEIVIVHVSRGEFGNCNACWHQAKDLAVKMHFDLDSAVSPDDDFWLPGELVFDCQHREKWRQNSIFAGTEWLHMWSVFAEPETVKTIA
jgi:hypothetical protein